MTIVEVDRPEPCSDELPASEESVGLQPATGCCHLVWDLPNHQTHLGEILGHGPAKAERPDFGALAHYLLDVAGPDLDAAATVFMNVPPKPGGLQGFVTALRSMGFAVFARPKINGSDIDDNLVEHVRTVSADLAHVLIGTHDRELIERCLKEIPESCQVTVLGFEEASTWAMSSEQVSFTDVVDIPGFFPNPLPRMLLTRLPDEGGYLKPLAPLHTATRRTPT